MKILLALILALPAIASADDNEATCRQHLNRLAGAVKAYRLIHNEKSPAKLSDLYLDGLADSLGDFVCPASGVSITAAGDIDAKTDYALGTGDILVREKSARHDGKALAVMADGSIKPVAGTAAPEPPRSTGAATTIPTPAAPTTVMRDAGLQPPVAKPTTPAAEAKPMFEVTKADPDVEVSFDGAASFGDFMGVTFAFQADGKLVVGSVKADSIGEDIGFKAGDPVVEINEKPAPKSTGARTVTSEELAKLAGAPAGQSLLITVQKADGEKITFSFMAGLPALPGR